MYEAVRTQPDGDTPVTRFVETAAEYGFDGIVVRNRAGARSDADLESIAETVGIDVVAGVEIRAETPQEASGSIGNFRTSHTIVIVRGGSNGLNRFAVEQAKVDVLAAPMAGSGDVNHVLAKAAAENGVRIEFDLSGVLRRAGGKRVRAIQSLRKLRELVEYYDAPFVVSADPGSRFQLRAPRELAAIGEQVGFSKETIEDGLREWGRLAERNREVASESFIEPGVKRGRYEEDG